MDGNPPRGGRRGTPARLVLSATRSLTGVRSPRLPVFLLVGWTIFLWVSRLRNVFADDDLSTSGVVWRVLVVVVFVAFGGVVVAALRTGRPPLRQTVQALALWTILYWLVRGTAILVDDYEASFKVVHSALMAVSIGVAAWAWSTVRSLSPDDHAAVSPR